MLIKDIQNMHGNGSSAEKQNKKGVVMETFYENKKQRFHSQTCSKFRTEFVEH